MSTRKLAMRDGCIINIIADIHFSILLLLFAVLMLVQYPCILNVLGVQYIYKHISICL